MFAMFTGSMFATCLTLAMSNLTQIEKLGSKHKVYYLAVLKPPSKELYQRNPHESSRNPSRRPYHEITYPLENGQDLYAQGWHSQSPTAHNLSQSPQPNTLQTDHETTSGSARLPPLDPVSELSSVLENATSQALSPARHSNYSSLGAPELNVVQSTQPETSLETRQEVISPRDLMAARTFAVLEMEPGENPWDLGSPFLNLGTVMGTSLLDVLFPIKRSPCCNHDSTESYYSLGPAVDRIKSKLNPGDMPAKGRHQGP